MYGPGDVRVEQVPDPVLQAPTDAIVRVTLACVCGSDLHPYHSMPASAEGVPMGHEFIGIVEQVGDDVTGLTEGDLVVSPFAFSDDTCVFCREGVHTSCVHGGFYAAGGVGGAQAEKVRVPQAQGTLVKDPVRRRPGAPALAADALGRLPDGVPRSAPGQGRSRQDRDRDR